MAELFSSDQEILLTRRFKASRELVFRVWTEPKHLQKWMCPKDFTVIETEVDLRVGGKWRTGMRSPDGFEYYMKGIYQEIIPPEKLVFTHSWEDNTQPGHIPGHDTLITITLDEMDGGTVMAFHVTGLTTIEGRDGQRGGWSQAFDNFEATLEELMQP